MNRLNKILNKRLRKFYFQRFITKNKNREKIASFQGKRIGTTDFVGESILRSVPNMEEVNTLGYTKLGVVINEEQVNSILRSLDKLKCFDGYRPELGAFRAKEIPNQTHVA